MANSCTRQQQPVSRGVAAGGPTNSPFVHRLHVGKDEANDDMKYLTREPGHE